MRSSAIVLKRPDIGRLGKGIVFGLLACMSSVTQASESTPRYDERLVPLAQTFLGLQLCASYATEQEQNVAKGDEYGQKAWALYDRVIDTGWDKQLFSSAMVVAHEQRASLEVRDDDTPESFKRRHQSGKPCEEAVATAKTYLAGGIPKPR